MSDGGNGGREALAEALSAELNVDLTPEFMAATDKVLVRLYLSGFIVAPVVEELA